MCFEGLDPILKGYTDVDMKGDPDNIKLTTRYLFTFLGWVISWKVEVSKVCHTLYNWLSRVFAITNWQRGGMAKIVSSRT